MKVPQYVIGAALIHVFVIDCASVASTVDPSDALTKAGDRLLDIHMQVSQMEVCCRKLLLRVSLLTGCAVGAQKKHTAVGAPSECRLVLIDGFGFVVAG